MLELMTEAAYAQAREISDVALRDAIELGRITLIEGQIHAEVADAQWARIRAEVVSQAEYARQRGVDPTSVRDAVKYGRIELVDGKVHPGLADVQWERNTRARVATRPVSAQPDLAGAEPLPPAAQPSGGPENAPTGAAAAAGGGARPSNDYQNARTRREMADAEQAEIKTAQLAGRLLEKEPSIKAAETVFRELRDAYMAVGRAVAPELVGLQDVRQIEVLINAEMRKTFDRFENRVYASLEKR